MNTKHEMHGASLNSPRLRDAITALFSYGTLTGWDWCRKGGFMNPGTVASEINRACEKATLGWRIECKFEGSRNHRKIYRYSVVRSRRPLTKQ